MAEFSNFAADSHQTPNVPGVRRFWKIRSKAFTASWPLLADTTTGEITTNPLTKLPAYFVPAEYVVPQSTKDGKFNNQPEPGYENFTHSFDYEMAGLGKDLMAEIMKNRNAQSIYIIEDAHEQLWLLGSSGRGLVETINGGFGKLGSDKRGLSISASSDGHAWPALPLSAAVNTAFLNRFLGYDLVRRDYVSNVSKIPNTSFTISVPDVKAFIVGDPVNVRAYFGSGWTPTHGPFAGTISSITLNGAYYDVVILGSAANSGSSFLAAKWAILKDTVTA